MRRYVVKPEHHRGHGPGRSRTPDDARIAAVKKYRAGLIAGKTQPKAARDTGFVVGTLEKWEKELGL